MYTFSHSAKKLKSMLPSMWGNAMVQKQKMGLGTNLNIFSFTLCHNKFFNAFFMRSVLLGVVLGLCFAFFYLGVNKTASPV